MGFLRQISIVLIVSSICFTVIANSIAVAYAQDKQSNQTDVVKVQPDTAFTYLATDAQASIPYVQPNSSKFEQSIYSEFPYYVNDQHLTHSSRYRLAYIVTDYLRFYSGLELADDFQSSYELSYSDQFWAPTIGSQVNVLDYFYLFVEHRWLFRSSNDIFNRPQRENEWRYGIFAYNYTTVWQNIFAEIYGESVVVRRIDTSPVTALWLKTGPRFTLQKNLFWDLYLEPFLRISPQQNLGPDEESLRLGTRFTFTFSPFQLSVLYHRSTFAEVPNQAMLTLGARW